MSDCRADYKDEAIGIIADACDEAIHQGGSGVSTYEALLYPVKRALARKWLFMPEEYRREALSDPEYALLVHEAASVAGVDDVTALARETLERAARFETHAGMCLRVKRNLTRLVEASDGSRRAAEMVLDRMVFPAYD